MRSQYHISTVLRICVAAVMVAAVMMAGALPGGAQEGMEEEGFGLLQEVWSLADERFFDPELNATHWAWMLERYGPEARQARSRVELAAVINHMLGSLDTSHTHLFIRGDPRYYQLLDVFSQGGRLLESLAEMFPQGVVRYADTGIIAREIEGKVFVTNIIDGMPASATTLCIGDEIVSVDGEPFQPLQSAADTPGPPLQLRIRRTKEAAERRVEVGWELVQPREMFLRAMTESVRVFEHDGVTVGSIHVWSWAGQWYQDRLIDLVNQEPISDADALVLDIRDGWGGARPWYLNLFNRRLPVMTMAERGREPFALDQIWRKPVVLLINKGSRSGKEIIAHGFKTNEIGPVVGTPTGGAVTAGSAWLLSDGSLLYLAVADVMVDGRRLEGVGVEPDILVPFDRRWAAGHDPQLERAVAVAAGISSAGDEEAAASPSEALRATETAFAKTMADRDHEAFKRFLADETIFFAGDRELRGKQSVAQAWKPFFEGEQAPFSWSPDTVAVLDSGGLGLSSGPVLDPQGERIGTFNSTWRKEADGTWKIVFDRGCPPCNCGS